MERSPDRLTYLSFTFIVFGLTVRLVQYFSNRSLWHDEASLAANILSRSYIELLGVLDNNQAAPPLFLWIEKLSVQVFGTNERSLRLFPFLAGIASLFLFYQLACRFAYGITIPIAIALFSSLKYTVYYAGEAKPYSVDLTVALLLFLMLAPLRQKRLTLKQNISLGTLGAVLIWLSYPSIFVLAGVELFGWLGTPLRKLKSIVFNRLPMYGLWLLSFLSLYLFVIRNTLVNPDLVKSWETRYPDSWLDFVWIFDALGRFFYRPLGFLGVTDGIAILAFCLGCISFYHRDKLGLILLNMPLMMTLLAAYLHQYPFRERLVHFLSPFAILIVAEGIAFLLVGLNRKYRPVRVVGAILLCALVIPPLVRSSQQILDPQRFQFHHIRPVIQYVRTQWNPGDRLFVFPSAQAQFTYYDLIDPFPPETYSFSRYNFPNEKNLDRDSTQRKAMLREEVTRLQGQERVWFLLSARSQAAQDALLVDLQQIGRQLDVYRQPDALACLYDLSDESPNLD